MISLHFILSNVEPKARMVAKFNKAVKKELVAEGHEWVKRYLKFHFEKRAFGRYAYAARRRRWNEFKMRLAKRGSFHWPKYGPLYRAENPPKPMVFTGRLRDQVLNKNVYQPKATKRQGNGVFLLRVPIRTARGSESGVINPRNRGELGRLNPTEQREMEARIKKRLEPKLLPLIKGKGRLHQRARIGFNMATARAAAQATP